MNVIPMIIYLVSVILIVCICERRVYQIRRNAEKLVNMMVSSTMQYVIKSEQRWTRIQSIIEEKLGGEGLDVE